MENEDIYIYIYIYIYNGETYNGEIMVYVHCRSKIL